MTRTAHLMLLILCLCVIVPPALATPPADWTWQNPLPQGNNLEAVWGRSANDVYAMGGQQTLMHWDGVDWSVASRPTSMPITDMWGLDTGVLFAVGWFGAVLRFDGSEWTEIPFPPGANLVAVLAFSETDVFVAERFPGRRVWHHDGVEWAEIGEVSDGMHDLGGSSPDDIYAVGFYGTMTHYDGADWTPVTTFPEFDITSVWSNAADDVFALLQGALLYHYDGIDWTQVGADGTSAFQSDMWGTSFTNVWFVDQSGGVSHFDGAVVTEYDLPVNDLLGVWGDGNGKVHTVGASGSLATYDGGQWTTHSSSAAYENLNALWQVAPDDIYAVGSHEIVIHWDGAAWTQIHPTNFSVWFNDVWAAAADDVFVVGKAGIKHYDGQDWTPMDDGLRHLLLPQNGIWGFGPDDIVAVAAWGAIVRFDGIDWTIVRSPDPGHGELLDVWGAAPDDIWAVGPEDEFLHWDGLAWNSVFVDTDGDQFEIIGWASDDIWTVGEEGELFHYDGAQWTLHDDLLGQGPNSIHGETPDDLHASSLYGFVWHHDDGAWTMADTGARTGLNAIWASSDHGVTVAGQTGTVLHGDRTVTAAPEFAAGAHLGLRSEPNPFNPSTAIRFHMPRTGHARLTIHDAAGRRVATLLDGEVPAGPATVTWDGRDGSGRRMASGVYLAQVRTDVGREVQKLTLVK